MMKRGKNTSIISPVLWPHGDPEVTWKAGRKARRQNLCASQHSVSHSLYKHHRDCGNLTAGVWLNPATLPCSHNNVKQNRKVSTTNTNVTVRQPSILGSFLYCLNTEPFHLTTEMLFIGSPWEQKPKTVSHFPTQNDIYFVYRLFKYTQSTRI